MRMGIRVSAPFLLCLAGCTISPPLPQQLVSVGAVMNSLMCGMVKAHQDPRSGPLLNGKQASVALELKIVSSANVGVSVGQGGPGQGFGGGPGQGFGGGGGQGFGGGGGRGFGGGAGQAITSTTSVIAWQGLSLTPQLSATYTQGWTVDTTTTLTFNFPSSPTLDNKDVCSAREMQEDSDQFGFSRWLSDTLSSLVSVSDISTTSTPDRKLSYDANFGVQSGANGSLTIIPLTGLAIPLTPNGGYSRNDVQHLTINIPAAAAKQPGAGAGAQKLFESSVGSPPSVVSLKNLRRLPE
jgi:hypothetical protein